MRLAGPKLQRGDTIIEVIFAVAVFSLAAVSSLAIMNRSIASGERSLEITLVRQQINAQAEAIRYIHATRSLTASDDPNKEPWSRLKQEFGRASASSYGTNGTSCTLPSGVNYNPFVLNARKPYAIDSNGNAQLATQRPTVSQASTSTTPPYSQVVYDANSNIRAAYGIWVEAVRSDLNSAVNDDNGTFIDFHIRACWPGPTESVPMTLGTIVRLYDKL